MSVDLFQSVIYFFEDIWFNFGFSEIIDILIVSVFIYLGLILLKRSRSFFIFAGLLALLLIYLLARFFNLHLTTLFFQFFFTFFSLIVVVVFQRELKNFFAWISASIRDRFEKLIGRHKTAALEEGVLDVLIKAAAYFSHNKIGALIVLEGRQPLESVVESGQILNGRISLPILLSIFDPSSAGHDGAIIIKENLIKQFGVHLPLAQRFMKFGHLGTRHRAALGLAERSDALVVVVSEERGTISLASFGNLRVLSGTSELKSELEKFLKLFRQGEFFGKTAWYFWFKKNIREKILALGLAVMLWFMFVPSAGITTREFTLPIEFRFLRDSFFLDQLNPKEIEVSLSGKKQDFQMLDPQKLLVRIDLSEISEGWQDIFISEKNIERPSSLNVIDYSPRTVKVHIVSRVPQTVSNQSGEF